MRLPVNGIHLSLLLLTYAATQVQTKNDLVVETACGNILGHILEQPKEVLSKLYAFEGIPYARPPVGERRFKDPEEAEPWEGIRNATAPGAKCIQKGIIFDQEVTGEEDCLFINVYTADPPTAWSHAKRPVMVRIHGGAYVVGSGNFDLVRPDPILLKDIIVVSFNYRLGVMGFLNTEDSEAPGNAAMKDAIMALRWVQRNIKVFGGDPEKVTVIGESAGSSLVSFLLLSPLTNGLIHGAISMSGDALAQWALISEPRRMALALRHQFNASCPHDASDAIVPCLQRLDAKELVEKHDSVYPSEMEYKFWKHLFVPSVEKPGASESPFLTSEPEKLLKEGSFLRVPYIMGFTSAEGILYLKSAKLVEDPLQWAYTDEHFEDIFRHEVPEGIRSGSALSELRKFYMGDYAIRDSKDNPEALRRFVIMMTDIIFSMSTVNTARLMSNGGAPVYLYEFSYNSPTAFFKKFFYNASHIGGVAHGEDLAYIYQLPNRSTDSDAQRKDAAVREKRVQLFTDFAKTGNPTPNNSSTPIWPLFTADEESFMEMDSKFTIRNHVLQERVEFWRRLAMCQKGECDEQPIVHVEEGALRGRRATSAAGCSYYSFQGIPYARPPIGDLRFKDAQPHEAWPGVRNAFKEGSVCVQKHVLRVEIVGEEDCLFLNVHTPTRPSPFMEPLPVMVWIHGGGFIQGSGDSGSYGPDYLVCEEIILVTLNYRLGALGFLYLEEIVPGNAGLKDQLMALRWVQKNIAAFGGNPNEVTLSGESAGSASVHLQMLSPLTKGLFHRAIGQSGTAMSPWAIQKTPLEISRSLAKEVGCTNNDSVSMLECLREVPANDLVLEATKKALIEMDQYRTVTFSFVPTTDMPVPGVETFLPDSPMNMIKNGLLHPVPFIIGITSREAVLHLAFADFRNITVMQKLDGNWEENLLPELHLPSKSSRTTEALRELRTFFMDGKPLNNDTLPGYMDMLSDIAFGEGVFFTIKQMSEADKTSLYVYSFDVDDDLNLLKLFLNMTDIAGAGHADDLGYIFRMNGLPEVNVSSPAALARDRMVRMWANFVKTGDPTPHDDPLLEARWKPYTKQESNFMDIGQQLIPRTNFYEQRRTFWEKFYEKYSVY